MSKSSENVDPAKGKDYTAKQVAMVPRADESDSVPADYRHAELVALECAAQRQVKITAFTLELVHADLYAADVDLQMARARADRAQRRAEERGRALAEARGQMHKGQAAGEDVRKALELSRRFAEHYKREADQLRGKLVRLRKARRPRAPKRVR